MARVESSISSEGLGLVGPWFGLGWLGMSLGVTKRLSEGLVVALGRNIWDKSRAGPNLSQMGPCARPVRLRASCRALTVEIYDGYWAVKVPCGNINLTRNGLQKSTGVPYIDGTGFQKSTGMPFQA
ncbi:polygalacturonase [Dorcoceras hygrometricum]|uniref:Polygalacturonase n=1 Tax=Dorcoceras hygrometricum TaxID=472368 RepID=A0A2Z6ZXB5_9LAMI|nr:polygalacturonase [Dorcoceras hygrometricum]